MSDSITFRSCGIACAADLLLPVGRGGVHGQAVILGRGFGGVKEGNRPEAEYFRQAGFVVLSIDYRHFGESEGEPRGVLHPLDQVEDFRSAISFLGARPEVDASRIGLWGTSFAGGIVLYAAAVDRRVRAVVAQMPIVHGGRWLRSLRSAVEWENLISRLEEDRRRRDAGQPRARVKLSTPASHGEFSVMPGDEEQAAHFVKLQQTQPTWRDDITLESLEHVIDFRPIDVVADIAPRAACIVTAAGYDPVHPLDQIQDAYALLREPRRLELVGERGMDLRFDPGWSRCLDLAVEWFKRHLGA